MSDKLKAISVRDEKLILSRQNSKRVVVTGANGAMAIVPAKYVEEVDEGVVR